MNAFKKQNVSLKSILIDISSLKQMNTLFVLFHPFNFVVKYLMLNKIITPFIVGIFFKTYFIKFK